MHFAVLYPSAAELMEGVEVGFRPTKYKLKFAQKVPILHIITLRLCCFLNSSRSGNIGQGLAWGSLGA